MPHRAGTAKLARLLGRRIRALREEVGITQEALAWDCDLTKSHLSQIEAGRGLPSVPVACALAKRLGLAPLDLFAFDEKDPRQAFLDAVRREDREATRAALKGLGLA